MDVTNFYSGELEDVLTVSTTMSCSCHLTSGLMQIGTVYKHAEVEQEKNDKGSHTGTTATEDGTSVVDCKPHLSN